MGKYLVIFSDNHGEEFDVNGFRLMSEKEADKFEDLANNINFEFNYYANSECLSYSNGEDFLSRIEFKSISNEEYEILNKMFGNQFGMFIGEDFLLNVLNGEDNNIDEDEDYNDNW